MAPTLSSDEGRSWAGHAVMPADLHSLKRHSDVSTIMRHYVGADARATADVASRALESANLGADHQDRPSTTARKPLKTKNYPARIRT